MGQGFASLLMGASTLALALPQPPAQFPVKAITSISGAACVHARPWVCSTSRPNVTLSFGLTAAGQAWIQQNGWPIADMAPGAVRINNGQGLSMTSQILPIEVQSPTVIAIGNFQHPAAIIYLDSGRLPAWPRQPLDTRPPSHNVPPPKVFTGGPAARHAYLAAIVRANRQERKAAFVLPGGFARLSPVDQLFVLANLERIVHGLWPLYGVSRTLNHYAVVGARRGTDPEGPPGSSLPWGSNWYSGTGPVAATYLWMYDDGYGSGNLACPNKGASGCWGHRDNILGNWGPFGLFGGAVVPSHRGVGGGTTQLFQMGVAPAPPAQLTYTWAMAVKAGARPIG